MINLNIPEWSSWQIYVGTLILSIFAYLIGSINGAQIYSRFLKNDLGKFGSGNYGGTNAFRTFGKKIGTFVMLIDIFKGIGCSILIAILHEYTDIQIFNAASMGISLIFIVVGHIWPIYFGFKGGKGVSVALGVLLVCNWSVALIALSVFFIASIVFERVSVGSILAAMSVIAMSFSLLFLPNWVPQNLIFSFSYDISTLVAMASIGFVIIIKHYPNIKKIIKGEHDTDRLLTKIKHKIYIWK